MTEFVKIAVDAMGGDGSPKKIIDGIHHHYKSNKDVFYNIFGNEEIIKNLINKNLSKDNYKIFDFKKEVKSNDSPLEAAKR